MMKNIRPIKTEADDDWAIGEIAKYFDRQPAMGSPDGDRFDVLSALVEAYENEHYPIAAPDPISAIRSDMERSNLTQSARASILGSRPRASEVLNRKRALTVDMIYKLTREWHIPADILVQSYHLENEVSRGKPKERQT